MKEFLRYFNLPLNHRGRLNRKPFLLHTIAGWIYAILLQIGMELFESHLESSLELFIERYPPISILLIVLMIFIGLFFWFVYLNLTIKRFHDLNMSGWHYLGFFIPFYNVYLTYKLYFKKGTVGHNRFGIDPLEHT